VNVVQPRVTEAPANDSARPEEEMSVAEIRQRASAGAALVTMRGAIARGLGFAGTIVLARLLVPEDFGLVAIGLAVWQFGMVFSTGGLGAMLVGRPKPPERAELRAMQGFQLALTVLTATATAAISSLIGGDAWVIALIVASLPFTSIRAPAAIQLERTLSYKRLTTVEIAESCSYYAWAIGAVAAGWGVWGLASASLAQACVGSTLMVAAAPTRVLRPSFHWRRLRPMLGFGLRFQGNSFVDMVRTQGLNIGTGALAGMPTLGLWSLAYRIMLTPNLLFQALWRVSYPANSRLLAAGADPRPTLRRAIELAAIACGGMFTAIVGSAPALVPAVFGSNWNGIVWALPPAALGQLLAVPLSIGASGYLWAVGDASTPLRANLSRTVAWACVAFALLPWLGVAALGVGWLAGSLAQVWVLGGAVRGHFGVRMIRPLLVPTLAAIAAAAVGWAVSSAGGASIVSAALGGAIALAVFMSVIAITRVDLLRDAWRLGTGGLRGAFSTSS
jgi:O-antigen/teichoic acid export membrane protein